MSATDGSILIDTKIDEAGFNKGVKSMSKTFDGLLNIVKGIGKVLAAAFIGGSIINSLRGITQSFDVMGSSVGDKIKPLADAFAVLKGAFVNLIVQAFIPMIPYLVMIVQWLTTMLQTVTQVVAALFGFKSTVGNIMTTAASNAKKAAKEAKGALAAFDQINLLQQQKQEDQEGPGGPSVSPASMAVAQNILDLVQRIKDIIAEWWADPIGKLQETWGIIVDWFKENVLDPLIEAWNETWIGKLLAKLWENFVNTWTLIFKNTSETIAAIKKNLMLALTGIIEFFRGIFTGDWALAWEGIKKIVIGVFGALYEFIKGSLSNWGILINGWVNQFKILWSAIAPWFTNAVVNPLKTAFVSLHATFTGIIDGIQTVFSNMINFVRNAFGSMADWLRETFSNAFNNIGDVARGAFNSLIDIINGLLNRISNAINNMAGIVNNFSWMLGGLQVPTVSAPNIPHLATGAVIPPNAAFAAVLGDQRSGRNIEAPESLIRQIVREETGKMQVDISMSFEGSLAQLVRELKPHIDREGVRVGRSIIK